ncbi:hypothetical protein C446_11567 [Halobiforma nitratireducens JCM 10879]|uniref:Uncharacterized protein n=1 Tax=Halobiforma nitratireducens JCM 10879 TaxID=1227454 RepID=M0LU39_9EURY|nr:hypothetical protein C446_11567 [Halobiforma nitratireducens JCM 10879]
MTGQELEDRIGNGRLGRGSIETGGWGSDGGSRRWPPVPGIVVGHAKHDSVVTDATTDGDNDL